MTLTLTAMRGYPGAGKSTRAHEIADETGAVVVCRDDLRKMLHGTHCPLPDKAACAKREQQVTVAEHAQVVALLKADISVVVDATHLEPRYLRKWVKLAALHGAQFERVDVCTPVDECRRRDYSRMLNGGRYVGEGVIDRMAKRWPVEKWPDIRGGEPFAPVPVDAEWIVGAPVAILVDIDGTLAHMAGRSPYDYTQVHTDTVDQTVRWLVNALYWRGDTKVIIMSGRDDTCREATEKWLQDRVIQYHHLFMRPAGAVDAEGNKLPDYIVKHDLFNEHIRGQFNVRFVLDDRDQVVHLWRSLGLKCLQVAEGDF
ncbi:MAG: polynucleotide kinase [Mycobacterium sp.]|nr:MAG: polynucleotide kinase [Mycobacterium sp.]